MLLKDDSYESGKSLTLSERKIIVLTLKKKAWGGGEGFCALGKREEGPPSSKALWSIESFSRSMGKRGRVLLLEIEPTKKEGGELERQS